MTQPLPQLTDDDLKSCSTPADEPGFGALKTDRGVLPLEAMDVRARLDGLLSEVTVRQTFVNAFAEPLEATYIFPLPDRAAVTSFRMEVAGRVIDGVLKERGQARQDYEQAIQAGHRAAITEEERPGVFTLRVGNLMPGERATVRLTLSGPLPYADGEATFRFPLVVAPRYVPGTPLPGPPVGDGVAPDTDAVPDASRITPPVLLPGYPNPVRLSLAVDVRPGGLPVRDLRSSLHAVTEEGGEGVRRVRLQPGERLDRDFVLRFRVGEKSVRTSLALHPDQNGGEGAFVLTVVPPVLDTPPKPRDVVFVLDRSGSMGGWKMIAARRALARMVGTLTDRDRFAVYAFDDRVETPPEFGGLTLVSASAHNRFRAEEWLGHVNDRGGTEMAEPLRRAAGELTRENDTGRDRVLVLVTDGQVGNEDEVLKVLGPRAKQLRIFTLGIDRAVNEGFLRRLAALGGGSCELVESEGRLADVMDSVHRRIGTPVLTGLKLEPAGLAFDPTSVVPSRLPDLFVGAPLFVLGRYRGAAQGGLALQASDAAGRPWRPTVGGTAGDNPAAASVWARGRVRELEDLYAVGHGDRTGLEKQIIETSLKFGVLCRFTAFVAVDRSEVVNAGGEGRRIIQPVEAPSGWEMLEEGSGAFACIGLARGGTPAYSSPVAYEALRAASPAPSPPQTASAPPPVDRSASLLGQILGSVTGAVFQKRTGRPATPESESGPVDLTAYRRRAAELAQQLHDHAGADAEGRRDALEALMRRLTELVVDLKSVGAADEDYRSLVELLDRLRAFLGQAPAEDAELARLGSEAEAVLTAFAEDKSVARRKGFWK